MSNDETLNNQDEFESNAENIYHLSYQTLKKFYNGNYMESKNLISNLIKDEDDCTITFNKHVCDYYQNLEKMEHVQNLSTNEGLSNKNFDIYVRNIAKLYNKETGEQLCNGVPNCLEFSSFIYVLVIQHFKLLHYYTCITLIDGCLSFISELEQNLIVAFYLLKCKCLLLINNFLTFHKNMFEFESYLKSHINSLNKSDTDSASDLFQLCTGYLQTEINFEISYLKLIAVLSEEQHEKSDEMFFSGLRSIGFYIEDGKNLDKIFDLNDNCYVISQLLAYKQLLNFNPLFSLKIMQKYSFSHINNDYFKIISLNNHGIVFAALGRFETAILQFNYAAKLCKSMKLNNYKESLKLKHDAEYYRDSIKYEHIDLEDRINYNTGISLFHNGYCVESFKYLKMALRSYSDNPRLWLRLAECITMIINKVTPDNMNNEFNVSPYSGKDCLKEIVGQGIHRKYIIYPSYTAECKSGTDYHIDKKLLDGILSENPEPSYELARICIENALNITDKHWPRSKQLYGFIPCRPAKPMFTAETEAFIMAVYSMKIYILLHLGDYYNCLYYGEKILHSDESSPAQKYVVRMYMAEAYMHIDKISIAATFLNIDKVDNVSVFNPNQKRLIKVMTACVGMFKIALKFKPMLTYFSCFC
ncbi:hypothetical protein A3Q56_04888 [Intoshia linei]|uniref:CCR4-NOT transcription complex subunit 10 n=1 Tax=Intoshia linei TaxID=1819745 RepID=A0A177AZC9_9BILA|nr:hypothetical protein A3Q56_04888 [Intoshia linei]